MSDQRDEQDEGVFKKPLKGSFRRVGERMEQEMQEKSPSEAFRDDFGGPSEPTEEEEARLDRAVGEERARRAD